MGGGELGSTAVVPELDVTDLDVSLDFYVGVVGFTEVQPGTRTALAWWTDLGWTPQERGESVGRAAQPAG